MKVLLNLFKEKTVINEFPGIFVKSEREAD